MADDGGQQTLSPYHAMACNPVTTVDPLGLKGLEVMSVGMQIMTPQEIAYWSGGSSHTFDQFTADLDNGMLAHDLYYGALQGEEQESGYASSIPEGVAVANEDGPNQMLPEVTLTEKRIRTWRNIANTVLDVVQTGLDIVGVIPGAGEIADGLNAVIYLARGDYANAALSTAAMIPIAGWTATGGKLINKAIKTAGKDLTILTAKKSAKLWTSTRKMSSVENAFGHWKKHGAEFPNFTNAKQYVEGAKKFFHNSPAGTLIKTRANGDILKYHPETNTFGVMDASGALRTMFKPEEGMEYWLKQ